jgi:hypothetical protein
MYLIYFFGSCKYKSLEKQNVESESSLSSMKNIQIKNKEDSGKVIHFDIPEYNILRKNYVNSYDKVNWLDTLIVYNNDSFKISLKHYCLFDSLIIIPKEYIWENTDMDKFYTHNYIYDLKILKNQDPFFDKTISKENFNNVISEQLKKFGTLRFPNFKFNEDKSEIVFQLTICIPITDIGSGVYLIIDKFGNMRTIDNYSF